MCYNSIGFYSMIGRRLRQKKIVPTPRSLAPTLLYPRLDKGTLLELT